MTTLVANIQSRDEGAAILNTDPRVAMCVLELSELSAGVKAIRERICSSGLSFYLKKNGRGEIIDRQSFTSFKIQETPSLMEQFPLVSEKGLWNLDPNYVLGLDKNGKEVSAGLDSAPMTFFGVQSNQTRFITPEKHRDHAALTTCFYMAGKGLIYYSPNDGTILWSQDYTHEDGPFYITMHRGEAHRLVEDHGFKVAVEHDGQNHGPDETKASMTIGCTNC